MELYELTAEEHEDEASSSEEPPNKTSEETGLGRKEVKGNCEKVFAISLQ